MEHHDLSAGRGVAGEEEPEREQRERARREGDAAEIPRMEAPAAQDIVVHRAEVMVRENRIVSVAWYFMHAPIARTSRARWRFSKCLAAADQKNQRGTCDHGTTISLIAPRGRARAR